MACAAGTTSRVVATTAALLLLSACAGRSEKNRDDETYVIPFNVDVTRLLSPPPVDEPALARDLQAVRAAQVARTAEQAALAEASSTVDVFLFTSVLGPDFIPERLPRTARFFGRVYRSALPYLESTKNCWSRPRPFVVDPTLAPLERSLASTRSRRAPATSTLPESARTPADSPCTTPPRDPPYSHSYPSGHATVGAMMAILLADMVPEQRVALFARGWEYGDARVVSGVHFPSDVEAGRILGTMLVGLLEQDAHFRSDLHASRQELRAALGYP